jgi:hypothetical protein
MPRHLIDYIRHPETLDAQALTQLRALVDKYPYYQAARIMYLRTLYQMHDPTFDGELRRAAVCLPSRKTLYELFEGESLSPENPIRNTIHQKTPETDTQTKDVDSTEEFLTGFLDSQPSANVTPDINALDAHQDYMEWLVRSGSITKTEDDAPIMGQATIDTFLDDTKGHITLEDIPEDEQPVAVPLPQRDLPESQLTEALAHIYIKQKQYEKARKIILRIIERKGETSRHHVDLLRFLNKLIINQSNI